MVTVYLVGASVGIAALIGIPIGLNNRLWSVVQAVIDTLQTLLSFVCLILVVMLFRVGDFTAMVAVVLYTLAPAVRYTALGIRGIGPQLIEASRAMGTTRLQRPTKVRLPLAVPKIMLGINQTSCPAHTNLKSRPNASRPRPSSSRSTIPKCCASRLDHG